MTGLPAAAVIPNNSPSWPDGPEAGGRWRGRRGRPPLPLTRLRTQYRGRLTCRSVIKFSTGRPAHSAPLQHRPQNYCNQRAHAHTQTRKGSGGGSGGGTPAQTDLPAAADPASRKEALPTLPPPRRCASGRAPTARVLRPPRFPKEALRQDGQGRGGGLLLPAGGAGLRLPAGLPRRPDSAGAGPAPRSDLAPSAFRRQRPGGAPRPPRPGPARRRALLAAPACGKPLSLCPYVRPSVRYPPAGSRSRQGPRPPTPCWRCRSSCGPAAGSSQHGGF